MREGLRRRPSAGERDACALGWLWSAIACILALTTTPSAQQPGLTAAPEIARVYDTILDARFEQVTPLLAQTCKAATPTSAPAEVCQLLDLVSLWWQIQLDPDNRSRDMTFRTRAESIVEAMESWSAREPKRAEAWFYLGGAYGARAQWRVLRGERVAAARDGKRIKEALEQALMLDPGLQDAWFGIGLYHYYADVAPAAARLLRFLLLLPGGDKVAGMQEMTRARTGGQLLRDEADYQLHLIDLWYEKQPKRALELVRGLRDRHPRNPHFHQVIAEIEDAYLHDTAASLRSWQSLLDAARAGRVAEPGLAETRARLGIALQLDRMCDAAAIDHLRGVITAAPSSPYGAIAQAHLQLAHVLDRRGQRNDASTEYRAGIASAPPGDPQQIAARARAALRATPARAACAA